MIYQMSSQIKSEWGNQVKRPQMKLLYGKYIM